MDLQRFCTWRNILIFPLSHLLWKTFTDPESWSTAYFAYFIHILNHPLSFEERTGGKKRAALILKCPPSVDLLTCARGVSWCSFYSKAKLRWCGVEFKMTLQVLELGGESWSVDILYDYWEKSLLWLLLLRYFFFFAVLIKKAAQVRGKKNIWQGSSPWNCVYFLM